MARHRGACDGSAGVVTRRLHAELGTSYCRLDALTEARWVARSQREWPGSSAPPSCGAGSERRLLGRGNASIERDGEEEVYDLTVGGLHNFVAD